MLLSHREARVRLGCAWPGSRWGKGNECLLDHFIPRWLGSQGNEIGPLIRPAAWTPRPALSLLCSDFVLLRRYQNIVLSNVLAEGKQRHEHPGTAVL